MFTVGAQRVEKPWTSDEISDREGLKKLALELNPVVGYYDPFGIGDTEPELIGWYVGPATLIRCLWASLTPSRRELIASGSATRRSSTGASPWPPSLASACRTRASTSRGTCRASMPRRRFSHADISAAGGPLDQWAAVPSAAKLQILFVIGLLEIWGESSYALEAAGEKHYVRGGKPGVYPSFAPIRDSGLGQPTLDLFDPFGLQKKMTPEKKAKSLLAELNNGRLAMIGIIGLVSASKGCIVPGLDSLGLKQSAVEPMAYFSATNADLPFVSAMLDFQVPWAN